MRRTLALMSHLTCAAVLITTEAHAIPLNPFALLHTSQRDPGPPSGAMAESLNKEKARRAAKHPDRPGEQCRAAPGAYAPVVDRSRCEGKRDCVEVCPYGVFEVRRIDDADFAQLSFVGRLKSRAHKRQTAYTPHADACRACGLCVVACPEDAIKLVRLAEMPTGG